MENIVLKASHLKRLKICTESEKQLISFLPVRLHDQMNHWIVDKHKIVHKTIKHQCKLEKCFT